MDTDDLIRRLRRLAEEIDGESWEWCVAMVDALEGPLFRYGTGEDRKWLLQRATEQVEILDDPPELKWVCISTVDSGSVPTWVAESDVCDGGCQFRYRICVLLDGTFSVDLTDEELLTSGCPRFGTLHEAKEWCANNERRIADEYWDHEDGRQERERARELEAKSIEEGDQL